MQIRKPKTIGTKIYTLNNSEKWLRSKSLQAINVGKGVEKREPTCTVGGSVN